MRPAFTPPMAMSKKQRVRSEQCQQLCLVVVMIAYCQPFFFSLAQVGIKSVKVM